MTGKSDPFQADPRTKLIIIICMSSLAVLVNYPPLLAALFFISLMLLKLFGVSLRSVCKQMRALLAVVLFITLIQSLFGRGGRALITIGGVGLFTTGGVILALEFFLRMLIIFTSAGILSSCGSREIIQGLVQMKLPYEIAFMAALGIRFLPVFGEELRDARTAIQLRGVNIKALKFKQKLRVYAHLLQPVAAGALIKSRALSMSIEMRGFRSFPKRVSYRTLGLNALDYTVMAASILFTAGALAFYYICF
ncbi:energy-coupling factor transporter transmembrane protein EcfT [Bacillota bacterium]